MIKIRETWTPALPPVPERDLQEIAAVADGEFYEACACFWLFRCLHRSASPEATLEGDYCFGRFSHHLSALDSVALTDAFADFLRSDTVERQTMAQYLAFIRSAGALI